MSSRISLAVCAALATLAVGMTGANAAGCDSGTNRQRIECLGKQLDAMATKVAAAVDAASKAKATADEALRKVGEIKPADLNNVVIRWHGHGENCLYVEDGTGNIRAGTASPICTDPSRQRFDIVRK